MIDLANFKLWLYETTSYSERTISNTVSRLKRADSILGWYEDKVYQFQLEQEDGFKTLSPTVRSQIKKAVKLYFEYLEQSNIKKNSEEGNRLKALSLFANIGVAEAYLEEVGIDVVVANELIERRATLYSKIYPKTQMVCGDITDDSIKKKIVGLCENEKIDIIMATPPCQGIGLINDMYAESNNDDHKYATLATQEDFDRF